MVTTGPTSSSAPAVTAFRFGRAIAAAGRSPPALYAMPSFSSSFNGGCAVAVADFNGDGKLDAVLTNTNSNSIAVLLGNGTGGFGTPFTYSAATFPTNGVVGDFNGDGKADIG